MHKDKSMTCGKLEKTLQVTLQLIEIRKQVREWVGDKYEATIEPYRAEIRKLALQSGVPLAQAGYAMLRHLDKDPKAPRTMIPLLSAALADVLEGV